MTSESIDIECERPDGVIKTYRSGYVDSGQGYNQACGGWEHTETGEIYAIANWGSERHWKTNTNTFVSCGSDGISVHTSTQLRHGYREQMLWWFNEKDIDHTKLMPIRFRWKDAPVGSGYSITNGPQEGTRVPEDIPGCIPRAMMHAVHDKRYYDSTGIHHDAPQEIFSWWENNGVTLTQTWEEANDDDDFHFTEEGVTTMLNTMEEEIEPTPPPSKFDMSMLGGNGSQGVN